MAIKIIRWIVLLCSISLVACTSLHVVGPADSQRPLSALLAPDQRVIVTKTDKHRVALRVTAVSEQFLDGVEESAGEPLRLRLQDIAKVERREFSAGKTGLLVVAIGLLIYTLRSVVSAEHDILNSSAPSGTGNP